jgi:alkylation response protein AidB-like acyl-CoA dehydrogenase
MNLDFTDEQRALRETLRDFFEKESPPAVVRAAEPLGFDAALWRTVAELGLPAIAIPEDHGGAGAGSVELAIAAELLGRSLAPVPLIEAATAGRLLASHAGGAVLEPLVAGERLATLALHPAVRDVARLVPAGAVADLVVVLREDALLLIEQPVKPGPAIPNLGAMPLADCPIPADLVVLARGPEAVAGYHLAVRQWRLLTAAALVGIASRALEIGLDYVLQRRAFGVLIASFQTIQHRLADNATAIDGARLLAYEAAWADDVQRPAAPSLAAMSFLFASETAFRTASESLHFHGGYGYTLEYDIQLYFRRAKAWPLVAGDRRAGYAELAHLLYDPPGPPDDRPGRKDDPPGPPVAHLPHDPPGPGEG